MANVLWAPNIDAALNNIRSTATKIHVLSADPAVYADLATLSLGNMAFTAPAAFAVPVNGDVSGRKIMSTAITAGTVTATGTATKWAIEDGATILVNGSLSASQALTSGNSFTLDSFKIEIPDR